MTGSLETLPSREELKERLFDVIDKDGDDLLNKGEMRELAKLVGFDGGDDEWSQEYLKLCEEVGAAPAKGIPKVVVLELLDDRSETGCFCTEEDLQILLRGLEKREVKAVSSSRVEKKSKQVTARRREGRAGDDVFFSGVPIWTAEDAIRSFFQHAGEVLAIRLFRHKDGTSQGMGYVTFGSTKQASRAVASLNQEEMVGYPGYPIQVQAFDHQEEKQKALPARQENRRYVEPPRVARARETREAREAQKTGATGGRRAPAPLPVHRTAQRSSYEGWYGGEDQNNCYDEWEGAGYSKETYNGYPRAYDSGYEGAYDYDGYDTYDGYKGYEGYGSGQSDGRALYFVGAPFEMTQEKLRNVFQEYGTTTRFWLFRLPDGRSRGQGLVEYSTAEEARYAIHYLHGRRIGDRTLKVQEDQVGALDQHAYEESSSRGAAGSQGRYAPRWDTRSVFFSGAPSLTPFRIVQTHFEEYGEVEHFNMFRHSNGKARGMGVVTFVRAETALQVLMSSIEVDGWHLFLKEADQQPGQPHRARQDGAYPARSQYDWSGWEQSYPSKVPKVNPDKSLYFANVAYESTDTSLRNRFGRFGSIKTLHMLRTKDGQFKGKGIVEFGQAASARRAYDNLHDVVFNGRRMVLDEFRPDVDYNQY